MVWWNSTSWTGRGSSEEINEAILENEVATNIKNEAEIRNQLMGGSSGAWHPGPPQGTQVQLGGSGMWSPGQAAVGSTGGLYQGYGGSGGGGGAGIANIIYSGGAGGPVTAYPSNPNNTMVMLPGGVSSGTKYVYTYDDMVGWTLKIEEPDPRNQQIISPNSFSLSEIEEAQETIRELEKLNG